jgi:hypothetical protein
MVRLRHLACGICVSMAMGLTVVSPQTSPRLTARTALLEALPLGQPPKLLDRPSMVLVNRLEAAGTPPSTAEFLSLGLQGRWELIATVRDAAKLEPGFSPAAANAVGAAAAHQGAPRPPVPMGVARAEALIRPDDRAFLSSAWFQLRDGRGEQIGAKLEVESRFTFEDDAITGKAVLDLRSSGGTRLMLPTRNPGCSVDALMEALHARLSPEYSLAEGAEYMLRLQTTYLDESIWVTRSAPFCCSVYHRADDEMAWMQGPIAGQPGQGGQGKSDQ